MNDTLQPEPLSVEDKALTDALMKYLGKGGTLKSLQDISPETIETLYAQAYASYQASKFDQALKYFRLLGLLDHYDVRFPMGSGLCKQRLGEHEAAIEFFAAAGVFDVRNPEPPFCVGESLIQLGRLDDAKNSLISAIHLAGNRSEYQALKKRANQLLELISIGAS